jgi:cytochrome c oxidase subunit 2
MIAPDTAAPVASQEPIHQGSFWLPKAISTLAPGVDNAWNIVMWVCVFFFVLVIGTMFYFMWKYKRRTENDLTSNIDHSARLEIAWTLLPLIIVMALFFVGLTGFMNSAVAPSDSYEIQVTGERWLWTFLYPNGTISPTKLIVPKGKPVRMVMSSKDVIHSFFVPEFRIKRDVIPGQYTSVWFEATEVGKYTLECTEYCGTGHSDMLATVEVMEPDAFKQWLEAGGEDKNQPPAKRGEGLFAKWQCGTCHSLDGSKKVGPSLKGLFNRDETMNDGKVVKADENYLRESILVSNAKVVKGYEAVMPLFKDTLKDDQVDALIAYIKEQK